MPVKHWSFAGLILTHWCNARCDSCYLNCGPDREDWFELEEAIGVWRSLIGASPHGCRVHLTGGEPFGRWEFLMELCKRANREGLAPLEKVETNAFWAKDEKIVRDRVAALDAAGMHKFVVSADPYHQRFVPIERCRLAARVAEDLLGPQRVQVRWRDWLKEGFDTDRLARGELTALFSQYARRGRDRLNCRAAELLARLLPARPVSQFDNRDRQGCRGPLLRSRHVHVGPDGLVTPGVCAGIVLGAVRTRAPEPGAKPSATLDVARGPDRPATSIAAIWRSLREEFSASADDEVANFHRPIVSALARQGPVGLLDSARSAGFTPAEGYASKCHLCWDIRRFFVSRGMHKGELGPAWLYGCCSGGA